MPLQPTRNYFCNSPVNYWKALTFLAILIAAHHVGIGHDRDWDRKLAQARQ
jgi:hypothetical protein